MEAISFLSGWTTYLFGIIPVGAGAMVAYQALKRSMADDEETVADCNQKIKNTLKGSAVGLTLAGTITVIKSFYGM